MKVEFLHTSLSKRTRFIIAFSIYVLSAFVQVILTKAGNAPVILRFIAFGLLVVPLWFLKVRNFSNKPAVEKTTADKAQAGKISAGNSKTAPMQAGSWMTVTMTELDRLRDRIRATKKIKIPKIYSPAFAVIISFFSVFFLFSFFMIIAIVTDYIAAGFFIALELYLIFFPFLWFARIEKWTPGISGKIEAFGPVFDGELPKKIQLLPMFFNGPDDTVPSDIRLMLVPGPGAAQELKDELVGAQFQITYNKGPNGEVPYMYAVFITKGKGKIWQSLANTGASGYVTEPGSSTEDGTVYGTVVLRLDTKSRSDGYHTNKNDVKKLLGLVTRALEQLES